MAPDQVIAEGREDESKRQGRNVMGPGVCGAVEHRPEGCRGWGGFFYIALSNAILMLDHVGSYGD